MAAAPSVCARARTSLRALAAALLATALAAPGARARPAHAPAPPAPESAPSRLIDGQPYVAAGELARLLGATRFWRNDVRKMVLRTGPHRVVLTADNPFVVVDDRTVPLATPVRTPAGEWWVPVALLESLPRDSTLARLVWEPRRAVVVRVPPEGQVGSPRVAVAGGVTRVIVPADHPEHAQVIGRSRVRFRVRVPGAFVGAVPDTLPADGLVRRLDPVAGVSGATFELALAAGTRGFRVLPDSAAHRLVLEFADGDGPGLEAFAAEGPPGPRRVRVVVIDPAHGGTDPGVRAGGVLEKDLVLSLARLLRDELQRRLPARVVLTREDDRALTIEARAEAANRARADLVLSLHLDGYAAGAPRGATAYVPPATLGAEAAGGPGAGPLRLLPWRDVALRHAVESRALAQSVLEALALRGPGPVRLRETLPLHLLGVNAPGVSLECATLTSEADRERLARPDGLAALAAAIAEGVVAWQRNEQAP
jgi:N-acetylmuramoyl-L-alanine amidase